MISGPLEPILEAEYFSKDKSTVSLPSGVEVEVRYFCVRMTFALHRVEREVLVSNPSSLENFQREIPQEKVTNWVHE